MKIYLVSFSVLMSLFVGGASALRAAEYKLNSASTLWLNGDSTLHPFASTATVLTADIQTEKPDWVGTKIKTFEVTVLVEGLKSGEKGLDKNMAKALKASEAPTIKFHLLSDTLLNGAPTEPTFPINVEGTLSIAGKENKITMEGEAALTDKGLVIEGRKKILMTDYGIKPPTMMGVIKTKNEILVGFKLIVEPK